MESLQIIYEYYNIMAFHFTVTCQTVVMATVPHTDPIITGIIWRDGYKANPTTSNLLKTDRPFLSQEGLVRSYGNTCWYSEESETPTLNSSVYENNILRPSNPILSVYAHHYGNELHLHNVLMMDQVQYHTGQLNVLTQSRLTTMIRSNALQHFVESIHNNFPGRHDLDEVFRGQFLGVSGSESDKKVTHNNSNDPKTKNQFISEVTLDSDPESPDGMFNPLGTPLEINPFVTPMQETSPGLEQSELVTGTITTRAHLSP